MVPGERGRVERVLATARAFLAVASLVAIWIDPTEPSRYAFLAYGLMLAYVVYCLFILAWVRAHQQFSTRFQIGIHGIDVLWPAVISLFTSPFRSPFFIFDAFVLLEAAYRWGLQETLATGAAEVLLYCSALLFAALGPGSFRVLLGARIEINRLIMRPLYLAIMAYLMGYLGEQEKSQRAEASGIARLIGKVRAEVGFRGALRVVFEETLKVFGSNRTLLIVREAPTGRVFLWEGRRESSAKNLSLDWTEAAPVARSEYIFDPPGRVWLARRRQIKSSGPEFLVSALEDEGLILRSVEWTPPRMLVESFPFQLALGVALNLGPAWTGSWWLLDPDPGSPPLTAAGFLRALSNQLGPAIYGVFVLRRLKSQAGAMERARVARELHDGVIQSLIGMEMQVDVLRRKAPSSPQLLTGELARLQSNLHQEVQNLRELMQQMRPLELGPKQFLDFLANAVDKFRHDTGIAANFVSPLEEVMLTPRVGNEVARIVQEALVNVRKHSGARNVVVRFDSENGMWKLAIDDDGCGFDFSGRLSQADLDNARKGPVVIKERVRSIGGELAIESLPGRGSRLEISFPQ
jgi:signal transduction histidine kinase